MKKLIGSLLFTLVSATSFPAASRELPSLLHVEALPDVYSMTLAKNGAGLTGGNARAYGRKMQVQNKRAICLLVDATYHNPVGSDLSDTWFIPASDFIFVDDAGRSYGADPFLDPDVADSHLDLNDNETGRIGLVFLVPTTVNSGTLYYRTPYNWVNSRNKITLQIPIIEGQPAYVSDLSKKGQ